MVGPENTPAGLALRHLQILDEVHELHPHRYRLIRAQDKLAEMLGLSCTGEPAIWGDDGTVDGYDHNSDTCPIHEWLVPSDCPQDARCAG